MPLRRLAVLVLAAVGLAPLSGCIVVLGGSEDRDGSGWSTSYGALSAERLELYDEDAVVDAGLEHRSVVRRFDLAAGGSLRLTNLVGTIRVVPGAEPGVVVVADVRGDGGSPDATADLLDRVAWIADERDGRTAYVLGPDPLPARLHDPGIRRGLVRTNVAGRRIEFAPAESGTPVFRADVVVRWDGQGRLALRNVLGSIHVEDGRGALDVDTGIGGVEVISFDGRLGIDTSTGDVRVGTARGELTVDTATGAVRIGSIGGTATIDTATGDVEIEGVDGEDLRVDTASGDVLIGPGRMTTVRVDTASGDIVLRGVAFDAFTADSASGDVHVRSMAASASRVHADTSSGDVVITAGDDASFRLSADTHSGKVRVHYADAEITRDGRRIVGARRGDGRTRIHVDTSSGDCTVGP